MSDRGSTVAATAWGRYRRLLRWMAVISAAAVVFALAYLRSRGPVPIAMAVATILGVGLSVMLGTALMGLVFVSAASGHDDAAAETPGDLR